MGIHTVIDCATGRPEEPIKKVSFGLNIDCFFHYVIYDNGIDLDIFLVKLDAFFNLGEAARVIACADDVFLRIPLCAGFQLSCEDEQGNLYPLTFYSCSSSLFYQ